MVRYLTVLVVAMLPGCGHRSPLPAVQEGDIVFQTSRSSQSKAVQLATGSRYSHMGMVLFKDNTPFVFEAVEPVKFTPLSEWIDRGVDGHAVVKRLSKAQALLSSGVIARFHSLAREYEGTHYDRAFCWDDKRMYCSELVRKMFDRTLGIQIGELQRMGDLDLSSALVRRGLKKRFGDNVPLDEKVISPEAMFKSGVLVTVATVN